MYFLLKDISKPKVANTIINTYIIILSSPVLTLSSLPVDSFPGLFTVSSLSSAPYPRLIPVSY